MQLREVDGAEPAEQHEVAVSAGWAALAVRMATKLSFAEARTVLPWFLPTVPSTVTEPSPSQACC